MVLASVDFELTPYLEKNTTKYKFLHPKYCSDNTSAERQSDCKSYYLYEVSRFGATKDENAFIHV